MAGIYFHIPFCKKACHYCDFYFTTSLKYKDELLNAMQAEVYLQKDYLKEQIHTMYFGGGTPSVIGASAIQKLIDTSSANFQISNTAEITLEANPDDLDKQSVQAFKQSQINRLSIGIQSFFEEDLMWMNRAHNAMEAESAVKRAQDAGFENITIDLIYGYPLLTDEKWKITIQKAIDLQISHISAYCMTVEPQTALASFINKGKQAAMNESQSAEQFQLLIEMLQEAGFEQYEISNFAKPGCYSKHNSNYWKGIPYLGIGPSAHSYNGEIRQWNISNNATYINSILKGMLPAEVETLSKADKLNEYIMTSLRTAWGMDLLKIKSIFGSDYYTLVNENLQQFINKEWIICTNSMVTLTAEGKLYADSIASELFITLSE